MVGALIALRKARQQFWLRADGEVDAFLEGWADDAVFHFPGDPPHGGTLRGKEPIREWFRDFHQRFPNARFHLERAYVSRPLALTADNEVAVSWTATLAPETGTASEHAGMVTLVIRGGKAVEVTEYFFQPPWGAPD
jgi:ketosteroid isomerase-like protein